MDIKDITEMYGRSAQAAALRKAIDDDGMTDIFLQGLSCSSASVLFASVARLTGRPFVFILDDDDSAGYFYQDLCSAADNVFFYPSTYRRKVKYGQKDAANEILRTEVLSLTRNPQSPPTLIVTYPEAISELVVSRDVLDERTLRLAVGDTYDITELQERLRMLGFEDTDYVYTPGRYAVRGSILDIWSFGSEHPCRIDFFGDEIDTIRTFDIETQLSEERCRSVDIVPELSAGSSTLSTVFGFFSPDTVIVAKDFTYVRDMVGRVYDEGFSRQAVTEQLENAAGSERHLIMRKMMAEVSLMNGDRFMEETSRFRRIEFGSSPVAKAQTVIRFDISPQPLFHKNFELLVSVINDYAAKGYRIYILSDNEKQQQRLKEIVSTLNSKLFVGPVFGAGDHEGRPYTLNSLTESPIRLPEQELFGAGDHEGRPYTPNSLTESPIRLPEQELFGAGDHEGRPYTLNSLTESPIRLPEQELSNLNSQLFSTLNFISPTLHEGYADNVLRCCFFTDHQIFDRFHKYTLHSETARRGKAALTMKELQEMEPGDFVVHVDLGIGRFAGLVRVPSKDGYQEVIRITYANNDKVDVSIHSLYKISRYKSKDSEVPPRLSTLGTGAWDRLKERAKTRIKDIARDLIRLYAARRREQGFAFSADTYMQHELEAAFMYEDTPDQLKAVNDVKADMESPRPMDRLVCGDVGFGKTEVAVRAAFKAACDNKQTAVLVPTTVLAYQHYRTFTSRLKDMPVRVEYLSRARSAAKTREIIADLAAGRIDIIIGTHKLIGKTVTFKDLGLLVIDEEQKFGVATKEKLRKLKTNVDTLTMTATPIPRTLQFSLMGARDMSIIRTPPPNRRPICTELHTFDGDIIAEAVNFEMARNGQVFFVSNRISSLPAMADMIRRRVPDARIAVGHGRMKPEELENILMGFINYEYDVLLSTTIMENGIDIPNANTIIINDAHRFGLADLHQMRGRVGRGNRKAFCYLLAPPRSDMTAEARRRLEALETFSELGGGFNLSMQDLDIRGAGNLLGAEQSGFMEELGYETYQKILNRAVTELRNDEFGDMYEEDMRQGRTLTGDEFVDDCAVESDLGMYFPDLYVPGSSERILLYRQLEHIADDASLELFRIHMRDRFGEIPREGRELLNVVPLRRIGKRLGCEKIMLKQGNMTMFFVSNADSAYYRSAAFDKVLAYIGRNVRRCNIREIKGRRSMVVRDVTSVEQAVGILRDMDTD